MKTKEEDTAAVETACDNNNNLSSEQDARGRMTGTRHRVWRTLAKSKTKEAWCNHSVGLSPNRENSAVRDVKKAAAMQPALG